ncbi:MAG: hypothetical protein KGN02_02965 [bacterium]|nr:hypothetical protein [bacterium]
MADLRTLDEIIAAGWSTGQSLEQKQRVADYVVDGARFGVRDLKQKSKSPNDVEIDQATSEIWTACTLFACLQIPIREIRSLDESGQRLERPDLDVILDDGSCVGVEIADASEEALRKHDAGKHLIERTILDMIDEDSDFSTAMGRVYFNLSLGGAFVGSGGELTSKRDANSIIEEIAAFILSGAHRQQVEDYFSTFPSKFKALHARGALYHASFWEHAPHFSVSDGAITIGREDRSYEVLRVLDRHRKAAERYRPIPLWIILSLTDPLEYFHNTVDAVAKAPPVIAPFVRGFLIDQLARVLQLP